MILALRKEFRLRKAELEGTVETIYFGGGTPSLLTGDEIQSLIDLVYENLEVNSDPEITLEANPDDLTVQKISELSETGINRLSIGVQSFFNRDLELMNRAHDSEEALQCISMSKEHFDNISVDLIYGIPGLSMADWKHNLKTVLSFNVPHISAYALTVEPKTALESFIKKGKIEAPDENLVSQHYYELLDTTEAAGYINYEFSNFGKPGFESRNNTAYWEGKPYLGIGPSAHSFDRDTRSWNIRNNSKYIRAIEDDDLPLEREVLSVRDKYNEYVMTGLRTQKGISVEKVRSDFGSHFANHLSESAEALIKEGFLILENEVITTSRKGKFLSDGIASDLFLVN